MHIFLFFFPGILLVFSRDFNRKPLSELLIYMVGSSLSFFVVLSWFIKYLHLPLTVFAYLVLICTLLLLFYGRKKIDLKAIKADRGEMMIAGIFLFILLLRCAPMFLQIAPAGGDMSMHSYIARLIYDNDGIPSSYEPILPISNFGAYPSGFPTLSALVSLLGDIPVYRSGLLMACMAHALICFGLYIFLLRYFDRNTSAATSIAATFLTRSPQWVIRWGGNPTVLALFFFIVAFSLIIELKKNPSWPKMVFASVALAAVLITHSIVFYIGGMILVLYFLLSIKDFEDPYATAGWLVICMLALLLPYLASLKFTLARSAIEATRVWQATDAQSVLYDLAGGVPFLALSAFGLPALFKKNRELAVHFLAITAVILLLILNYRFWIMPFSYLLYPGRVALFLIIPLAVFAGPYMAKMMTGQKKKLLIALSMIGFSFYCIFYLYNSASMCSVTRSDMDAFRWMNTVLNKRAVIVNNYGDAGIWIPAVVGMTITDPHKDPVYKEELEANLLKLKPDYIYIGSKAVYPVEIRSQDLEKHPWRYRRVYSNGTAQVWKILR
jgi:hypothetical protein